MSAFDPKRTLMGQICDNAHRGSHSGLMPAVLITLPHFSVNSTMNLPNSTGEFENGSTPKSTSRPLNTGSASAALTALLRIPMISAGVPLGAPLPTSSHVAGHELAD